MSTKGDKVVMKPQIKLDKGTLNLIGESRRGKGECRSMGVSNWVKKSRQVCVSLEALMHALKHGNNRLKQEFLYILIFCVSQEVDALRMAILMLYS